MSDVPQNGQMSLGAALGGTLAAYRDGNQKRAAQCLVEIVDIVRCLEIELENKEDELNRWQKKLDALGLAISEAGYTWTPEMRTAYEMTPNARN